MKKFLLVLLFAVVPAWAQGPPIKITVGESFGVEWDYPHFSATVRGCADTEINCISSFNVWDITGGVRFLLGTESAPVGANTPVTGLLHIVAGSDNQDIGLREFAVTTVLRTEIGLFESVDSVKARGVMVPLPADGTKILSVQ
ncbi:hypothetical protein LCGC14_2665090 [marine sediment metagenome]|uniref:Uncharacterized protein n=1 Tax=marine sediment metagenome TaxID=412755 RepID=A0A0F8ZQT3_9ZZZZ